MAAEPTGEGGSWTWVAVVVAVILIPLSAFLGASLLQRQGRITELQVRLYVAASVVIALVAVLLILVII